MRPDLHKVITERPRRIWGVGGSVEAASRSAKRAWRQRADDDVPGREGMRAPYRDYGVRKEFSDLLGPLERLLRSQVGRPWNLVWSELCRSLPADSVIHRHVRGHVFDFVDVRAVDDGTGVRPDPSARRRLRDLFVCPRTGILRAFPAPIPRQLRSRELRARTRSAIADQDLIRIDNTTTYQRLNGTWFRLTEAVLPSGATAPGNLPNDGVDMFGHREVSWHKTGAYWHFGDNRRVERITVARKQCSTAEIRRVIEPRLGPGPQRRSVPDLVRH